MKNLIRIPLTLALLFATCGFCPGQEFYRGELFVTGQHFSQTDGHLTVELSVDFENLQMPSDESLTVTPVLKSGEYEQELPLRTHQRCGETESVSAFTGIVCGQT